MAQTPLIPKLVIKRKENRDPVAHALAFKSGAGSHKGIKDKSRSSRKQKLKKMLKRGYDYV